MTVQVEGSPREFELAVYSNNALGLSILKALSSASAEHLSTSEVTPPGVSDALSRQILFFLGDIGLISEIKLEEGTGYSITHIGRQVVAEEELVHTLASEATKNLLRK